MDLLQITLIIASTYFILSIIIKGGLMLMYGYFMFRMFNADVFSDDTKDEPQWMTDIDKGFPFGRDEPRTDS